MSTTLERRDAIYVLDLGDGDHRFNGESVARWHAVLDEIESGDPGAAALVTMATGKVFHNGLDLDYMATLPSDQLAPFVDRIELVFARLFELPMATVAAMNGHAFAGGAMLALSHDVRIMRADRGYLCLPEIDLGLPFTPGMEALLAAKLPQPGLHRLAVLGQRATGPEALAFGAVTALADEADVVATAMDHARDLAGKASPVVPKLRANFYAAAIAALRAPHPG